jgi:hypothetical protein
MPSAFRRKGAQTKSVSSTSGTSTSSSPSNTNSNTTVSSLFRLRGVKPWQGGAYLTSSGLNDLDSILGGGHVLGTSILLEEDRLWTRNLATTLVKYWCAEVCSLFYINALFLFAFYSECTSIPVDIVLILSYHYRYFLFNISYVITGNIARSALGYTDIFEKTLV